MNNYNQIKKNIIEKFLVPYYKYTIVKIKGTVIHDISTRSWFQTDYDYENDVLSFYLGDGVEIVIKFLFMETQNHDVRLIGFE